MIYLVIVFVIDNFNNFSNGTSISALRFKEKLEEKGHIVRIVTNDYFGENIYTLKTRRIPVVSRIAKKQGVCFSKPNKAILKKAFTGANIVHFFTPWKTTKVGLKIAEKMNIPVTMAFHISPESIIYSGRLKFISWPLNNILYRRFKRLFKKVQHVHCPSKAIAEQLKKRQFPNQFHVISNGVGEEFRPAKKTINKDYYKILSIGRFSAEKDQKTILKAIGKSNLKAKIILTLAGIGPTKKRLEKLAKKLNINVKFKFYEKDELIKVIQEQDLYIHSSILEIESISCLEAMACGKVPVIANSPQSATSQFALDKRSLYEVKDSEDLKEKIEYWLLNAEERKKMELLYLDSVNNYKLDSSVDNFIGILKQAIKNHRNECLSLSKEAKDVRRQFKKGKISKTFSAFFYYLALPILLIYNKTYLRIKIINRKNFKKVNGGAVIVSNHVHILDSVLSGFIAFPKKVIFTSIQENFEKPFIGYLVKALGTVPTPESITENRIFFNEISKKARNGRIIHFFPEGELVEGDTKLREFKRGAFKLAVDSSVPILPVRLSFQESNNTNKKKRIVVNVGKPIMPDFTLNSKMAIEKLQIRTEESMHKLKI